MQRGLVHALAWSLATGGAVTVSWWGVHAVLAGTVYDPPRAVPVSAPTAEDLTSSTHRPPSSAPADPTPRTTSSGKPAVPPSRTPPSRTPPSRTPSPSHTPAPNTPRPASVAAAATPTGQARVYTTSGGRVVFEVRADSAALVSATPEPGWSVQTWTNTTWIRVDFARDDGKRVSLFCTWNDHAPQVDIVNS
ncbi:MULTISPECIES: hypothetical protein [unclassified Streptomyces]|uniref:hypothetical protein n=1 Tax=unclassified Streptomyces TaxID=2593676 RepID=UPI000DADCD63|nr:MULTISPECIES: hypothetical protein [unclassified Streptomyces]PZT71886.1 hypothetical protein DNK55_25010 [Streptomyces sp. AC1-42T]PZT81785.1 hypothetical protein DNK56_06545 [Streptomyces sp. AC1-42W]